MKIILILGTCQQVVPTRMSKKIREKINEDYWYTIDEISEATGVSWSYCQRILTVDLNMRHGATKFVPRLLTQDQKNTHLTLCQELKNQIESDPNFLSKVITGDESWCYGYDPETKQALSQWKTPTSPRPKKARQVRSNVKTMLFFFSMFEESCTGNSFLQDRRSIRNFTWRF